MILFVIFCFYFSTSAVIAQQNPNIIFILADDLGWNDASFHGSDQIPTPNIDALAYSGIILNNYYVTPICTPSRSALFTGKYPIHTGMQHNVLYGDQPYGLSLNETLLSNYLQDLGYATHIVGKWHLGNFKKEYTPTYRGFESHFGYWTAFQDYYDHTSQQTENWGYDMRENMSVAWDAFGKYTTDLITEYAINVIQNHDSSKPLFLYIPHLAVHSANDYAPLQAPKEAVDSFDYISNMERRIFAGMVSKLDESVGDVFQALQKKDLLQNSVVIFSADNGGPAAGFDSNEASNWPLRGVKDTQWEGGTKGTACIWSPFLQNTQRVSEQMMHLVDWLPTLYHVAGGDSSTLTEIDGIDMWDTLSENITGSPRNQFVINIDNQRDYAAVRSGRWKILQGTTYEGMFDSWYGPSGRANTTSSLPSYDVDAVINSQVGQVLQQLGLTLTTETVLSLRAEANVETRCDIQQLEVNATIECFPLDAPCLFDIEADPCERKNLADEEPVVLEFMLELLQEYNATVVDPRNAPDDPAANPKYWDYTYTNWRDYTNE